MNPYSNPGMQDSNRSLGDNIVDALLYFLKSIAYLLFICPFEFWAAATLRLAKDRRNRSMETLFTTSRWPYLSFCKKIIFGFFIDGSIFISYFLGVLAAVIVFIVMLVDGSGFGAALLSFLGILIGSYYSPLVMSFFRDMLTLFLLPFYKFLSWVSKPAQQLDIDMRKHGSAPAAASATTAQAPAANTTAQQEAPAFVIDATWQPYVGTEFSVTHKLANGQVEAFQPPYQTFELTANGVFDGSLLGATRFETTNGVLRLFKGSSFIGDFRIVNPNNNGLVEIADANGVHYYLYRNA